MISIHLIFAFFCWCQQPFVFLSCNSLNSIDRTATSQSSQPTARVVRFVHVPSGSFRIMSESLFCVLSYKTRKKKVFRAPEPVNRFLFESARISLFTTIMGITYSLLTFNWSFGIHGSSSHSTYTIFE
ncbi:MAG: hypothetical protein JOS17DRAFT_247981 [Linnemannia elongata]|nr:MAG: hypothetical protein JOS17DRAFT_247981 [Linnemannia elongata]